MGKKHDAHITLPGERERHEAISIVSGVYIQRDSMPSRARRIASVVARQ
ncbi:hypothetical protein ETAE_1300 [Edwardsiella piscicida]|uniref:Uncharacterized protein n=2 Tax=Edwardsiella TaxID=635 RepID=A0A0H3DTP3_EDWTF|nr:hypothetical protein ETAE_1300 [Edwardsiella tarda EIB202]ADM41328.1 hypothetical protein ETAF_1212 [Edwardsiella tarda FL6-60]